MHAGEALVQYGDAPDWLGKERSYSIGTLFDLCSWPEWPGYDKTKATKKIRIWRSPHSLPYGGTVWDEKSRFDTIEEWVPKKASGWFLFDFLRQLKQWEYDLEAMRRPLEIPWGEGWGGDGGTTDNGVIVLLKEDRSEAYEIQGLAPLNPLDVLLINLKVGADVARLGDFRVDGISHKRPGVRPIGSQGPKWKTDGLLRPEHLRGMANEVLRLVVFNNSWGPGATAARGGWVEHKANIQPYGAGLVTTPSGDDPRMIRCFQGFYLDISDAQIEQWIKDMNTPPHLVEARLWFARNLRGWETDADRPRIQRRAFESSEGGSWIKLIESVGWVNPETRAEWAKVGIRTAEDAAKLGEGIFRYGMVIPVD